jgi:hypothetical protein
MNWYYYDRLPWASICNYDTGFNLVSEFELPEYFFSNYSSLKIDEGTYYFAGNIYDTVIVQTTHLGIIKVTDKGEVLNEFYSYNINDSCTNVAVFNSIDLLKTGNVILCSSINCDNLTGLQQYPSFIRLTKLTPDLDLISERYIGVGEQAQYVAYVMRTTPEGGILVAGCYSDTPPNNTTKKQMIIFQTDGDGIFTSTDDNSTDITSTEAILYPNPASEIINIEFSQVYQTANFQLMDIGGKIVFEKQLNSNYQSINISALPAGTYVYRIFNKEGLDERGKVVVE